MARSVSRLVLAGAGLTACCLLGAGCGAGVPVADQPTARDEPSTVVPVPVAIPVPIAVPVAVNWPTNLELISAACPGLTDGAIVDLVIAFDGAWYDSWTYSEQIDQNTVDCAAQGAVPFAVCAFCYDSIVDFVYVVVH